MSNLYKNLPESPGVYLMKSSSGRILYIGKAANLRRRASGYFTRANDARIEKLLSWIRKIDYIKTDSALEALILESQLIKKHQPPFNVKEKDDKSFLYIEITKEKLPRVLLVRGTDKPEGERFGPFTSASNIREALRILRRIFPWSTHLTEATSDMRQATSKNKLFRACFDYEIGLCPGICIGAISKEDYIKNIKKLRLFLAGKKKQLAVFLEKEMKTTAKNLEFEKAAKLRRQLFALQHIRDTALIYDEKSEVRNPKSEKSMKRIEGYDISNTSGTSAVGSMVVFFGNEPQKNEYRKFKIRTIVGQDDVGMIREVLSRRLKNNWPLPFLILVDGGKSQVGVVEGVLREFGFRIPVVGIAKGPERKKNEFMGKVPKWAEKKTLIRVRDEAHRFAVVYHRTLRNRKAIEPLRRR